MYFNFANQLGRRNKQSSSSSGKIQHPAERAGRADQPAAQRERRPADAHQHPRVRQRVAEGRSKRGATRARRTSDQLRPEAAGGREQVQRERDAHPGAGQEAEQPQVDRRRAGDVQGVGAEPAQTNPRHDGDTAKGPGRDRRDRGRHADQRVQEAVDGQLRDGRGGLHDGQAVREQAEGRDQNPDAEVLVP